MESSVERITWKRIGQEIMAQLQLEKGLFFTIRDLLVRPGQAIRSILFSQERNRYVKPVGFLILSAALAAFFFLEFSDVDSYFKEAFREGFEAGYGASDEGELDEKTRDEVAREAQKINYVSTKYFNLLILLNLPVYAFFTWLFFRKEGFFYTEHIVLNMYLIGIQNLFFVPIAPYVYSVKTLNILYLVVSFGYQFFFYYRLFTRYPSGRRILNSLLSFAFGTLGYVLVLFVGAILVILFLPVNLPS